MGWDEVTDVISNLVPSTTRPPLRSMKSSTYAVFAFGATSKVFEISGAANSFLARLSD